MNNNNFLDKFKKVIWILTPFILIAIIIILLMKHYESEKECFDCNEMQEKIDNIEQKIKDIDCLDCDWENIDGEEVQEPTENDTIIDGEIVQKPTNNCRAHFSGLLMNDLFKDGLYTKIFHVDQYSEYVGEGEYPRAKLAFPKSDTSTFDGIAIDKNTSVIIYSKKDFQGEILLDITGPSIITNRKWNGIYEDIRNKNLINELETIFPENCRKYSKSDMHNWSQGSLKVICNE